MDNYLKYFEKLNKIIDKQSLEKIDSNIEKIKEPEPVKGPINKKEPPTKKILTECDICGSTELSNDYATATVVCLDCGVVVEKIENDEAEWRCYGAADNKSSDPTRCGIPVDHLLPISSMGTKMSYAGPKYASLYRLHKWNQMPSSEERSLLTVFKYIDSILSNTDISNDVKEETKKYYKTLSEKDDVKGSLTRGVKRKALIAACLIISSKNNNKPIQKAEVAKLCNITITDVTKGLNKFSVLEKNKNIQINRPTTNIHDYIQVHANNLNFTKEMIEVTHILCDRCNQIKILTNANDTSVCGGLLYLVSTLYSNYHINKDKITKTIKISGVTLDKIYKVIYSYKKYLLIGLEDFIH